jgi:hypothetical protein
VTDLIGFLRARLDTDESRARMHDVHDSGLTHPYDPSNPCDPTRVLAVIAAQRAIVAAYGALTSDTELDRHREAVPLARVQGTRSGLGFAVQQFAQIYASHPDFDPDWRT